MLPSIKLTNAIPLCISMYMMHSCVCASVCAYMYVCVCVCVCGCLDV